MPSIVGGRLWDQPTLKKQEKKPLTVSEQFMEQTEQRMLAMAVTPLSQLRANSDTYSHLSTLKYGIHLT